jgi:four helix bundle protein
VPLRHHSLIAWQRADDLFIKLHQLTIKQFPAFERFELGGQVRKAAYSVAANIVEGFARRHRQSRLYFLNISEGSLAEVGYCLHAACRLGYISTETLAELNAELNGVGAPLAGPGEIHSIDAVACLNPHVRFASRRRDWPLCVVKRSPPVFPSCPSRPVLPPISWI